jgi:hypothetical protein
MNGTKPETGSFRVATEGCPQSCPNVFKDPASALAQFRFAFPGESGQRNNLRGPGIFGLDVGVSKSFTWEKSQSVLLAVEAFNLTNTPRFDVGGLQNPNGANNTLANSTQFGNFINTASRPRVLQFAVRYNF